MSDNRIDKIESKIAEMKDNCFEHKLSLTQRFDKIESTIDNTFGPAGNIQRLTSQIEEMNSTISRIDNRLFRTNGTKALVNEVSDIKKSIDEHLTNHKAFKMGAKQYAFLVVSILLTSVITSTITNISSKIFKNQSRIEQSR